MSAQPTRRDLLKAAVCAGVAASGTAQPQSGAQEALRLPRQVKVAIIGLEGHYSEILSLAKVSPQVRVTAVADDDAERLRRAGGNPLMKSANAYADYRSMLEKEQLDVVAVCGENETRPDIVCACTGRKLPVVAEKPLAITLEDLRRVRHAVEKSGAPLTMLLPMRFAPQYRKMRELVRAGEVGDVVAVAAQKSYKMGERPAWMKKRSTFGGIIPYIGIHMVDLMRWVSGQDFVEAAAFQSNVGAPQTGEMENNAALAFRLDNGGTGSLRMDYLRPETAPTHGDDRLRIAGTRGVVEFQEGRGVTLITGSRKPEQITPLPPEASLFADFLQALYAGGRHVIALPEIFRVNEIVLKARDAAEKRTIVSL